MENKLAVELAKEITKWEGNYWNNLMPSVQNVRVRNAVYLINFLRTKHGFRQVEAAVIPDINEDGMLSYGDLGLDNPRGLWTEVEE